MHAMNDAFERLSKALEVKSPIEIDGIPFGIWVIDVRTPRSPGSLHSVIVVGAKSISQSYTGEMHVGHERLNDVEYCVENAIETMRQIVRGELPPGATSLL
jgi:hypothetical protein